MPRGKKTQELAFEVVDAGEMSQADADVVMQILAKMIYDSIQRESMDQDEKSPKGRGLVGKESNDERLHLFTRRETLRSLRVVERLFPLFQSGRDETQVHCTTLDRLVGRQLVDS